MSEAELELNKAHQARANGMEGRARVIARRAVSFAIRAHLRQNGENPGDQSAIDLLHSFSNSMAISPELSSLVQHFLIRVDLSYNLSPEIDLLADAKQLLNALK